MGEMWPVERSTSIHPPRCHCHRGGPESSERLSFTRKTRRTTNNRSVTSCGEPRKRSLMRPSTTKARIFSVTGLLSPVPGTHSTAVHFPKVMTWILGAVATALVRRVVAKSTVKPRQIRRMAKSKQPAGCQARIPVTGGAFCSEQGIGTNVQEKLLVKKRAGTANKNQSLLK